MCIVPVSPFNGEGADGGIFASSELVALRAGGCSSPRERPRRARKLPRAPSPSTPSGAVF